ncbi:hypothetical protein ABU952_01685 [Bacillus amyloliquefaciens]|uniref:hypothetical protein n=1 Tax=Bacillus amyloliquefaciens TaxID=1390 RepID=UPI00336B9482
MQDLIIEYKWALRETRKMYRFYKDTAEVNLTAERISNKKIISSIVSNIIYPRMAAVRKTAGAR